MRVTYDTSHLRIFMARPNAAWKSRYEADLCWSHEEVSVITEPGLPCAFKATLKIVQWYLRSFSQPASHVVVTAPISNAPR